MKKLIKVWIVTLVAIIGLQAGVFSRIVGQSMPERKPDAAYTVDVAGENIRVYEWRLNTDPSIVCTAVFSSNKMSVQCVPMR